MRPRAERHRQRDLCLLSAREVSGAASAGMSSCVQAVAGIVAVEARAQLHAPGRGDPRPTVRRTATGTAARTRLRRARRIGPSTGRCPPTADRSARWPLEADPGLDERRLAGRVRPDQGGDPAGRQREVDSPQGPDPAAVALRKSSGLEDRIGRGHAPYPHEERRVAPRPDARPTNGSAMADARRVCIGSPPC